MDKLDRDQLFRVLSSNPRLKELYKEHMRLEKEVAKYARYTSYSSTASLRHKELKKRKLQGKDEIMNILREECEVDERRKANLH